MAGDRHVRPDLVVGSRSCEIANQVLRRTPSPLTQSIGFSSFKNHESDESELLVAIHDSSLHY
jgi:hypothetical protein